MAASRNYPPCGNEYPLDERCCRLDGATLGEQQQGGSTLTTIQARSDIDGRNTRIERLRRSCQ